MEDLSDSLLNLRELIENNFQATHVHWEDFGMVSFREKKSTGEGRCQLSQWHLRLAVLNPSGNNCAKIKLWANRWKGELDPSLGH